MSSKILTTKKRKQKSWRQNFSAISMLCQCCLQCRQCHQRYRFIERGKRGKEGVACVRAHTHGNPKWAKTLATLKTLLISLRNLGLSELKTHGDRRRHPIPGISKNATVSGGLRHMREQFQHSRQCAGHRQALRDRGSSERPGRFPERSGRKSLFGISKVHLIPAWGTRPP